MKIGFILGGSNPEAQKRNPVTLGAIEKLRERGAVVDVIEPRVMTFELSEVRVRHDLYVIKSVANPVAAAYGATLHALGAATFNPFPVVQMIRNKIVTLRILAEHGVPVPATYVGGEAEDLVPRLDEGPLIVKPYMGSRGVGVERVATRDELLAAAQPPPILAQRFHQSDDGLDRKISMIGGEVFGVKRVFPLKNYEDKIGTPLEIDDETRKIALRISRALRIDLFSFDIVVSGGKPLVVDVGSFGSLMGIPKAPSLVADRIIRAWEESGRRPPQG
jgi:glutathione synthase/RimK-type ligase-like ATP-grasp enzyme